MGGKYLAQTQRKVHDARPHMRYPTISSSSNEEQLVHYREAANVSWKHTKQVSLVNQSS